MTREPRSAAADDRINRLVLEAHPDAQAIYRYGTSGTDADRPDSDVDVAVLLPHGAAKRRRTAGSGTCSPSRSRARWARSMRTS